MQCISSYQGIRCTDKKFVVKVRSDMLWKNQETLILKVFDEIQEKNSFAAFLNYKPTIREMHDFITFSTKDNGELLWGYRQTQHSSKSPESQLCDHICSILNLDYDSMVKKMSFINVMLEEDVTDLICIKYNGRTLAYQCNTDLLGVLSLPKK
jgi:hypothetical protein